jgi:hypothetical protein
MKKTGAFEALPDPSSFRGGHKYAEVKRFWGSAARRLPKNAFTKYSHESSPRRFKREDEEPRHFRKRLKIFLPIRCRISLLLVIPGDRLDLYLHRDKSVTGFTTLHSGG